MSKIRSRIITIAAGLALAALCLGLALGVSPAVSASAVSPSSIFWAMTGGEVSAYSATREDAEASSSFGYVTLVLAEDGRKEGTVEYHKDLALKWYLPFNENPEEGDKGASADTRKGQKQYFSMKFMLPEANFETFSIAFSSAEENVTKEGKSVNELIFKKDGTSVYAYLKDSALQEEYKDKEGTEDYEPAEAEKVAVPLKEEIVLAISEEDCKAGEFALTLNGQPVGEEHTKLTNVGGYFMEYRTSSTPNVPITFKATMPDGAENGQKVLMTELNGQSLAVTGGSAEQENGATKVEADGTVLYVGGAVEDNAPPAFVLNQQIYAFTLGQRYSLDYEVMDVCDDSLSVARYYYMAKKVDGKYVTPVLNEQQNKDGYQTLTTNNYFLPREDSDEDVAYVSIRYTVDDGRSGATSKLYYYLTWYADPEADVVRELDGFDYILINREKEAPRYTVVTPTEELNGDGTVKSRENVKADNYDALVKSYQDQLTEAAKNVSAGDGAYFYLPSLRDLITSDSADYRNLRFSIYYYKPGVAEGGTASSETTLRYNDLRFEIDEIGVYKFRIMAADASGNAMQMYLKEGDDVNDWKLTALSSGNIWDVDEIPEFTIDIAYTGPQIEPMGSQESGYRGSSYSISEFEIVAHPKSKKDYKLWYLNADEVKNNKLDPLSYDELVENAAEYLSESSPYYSCFETINKYNPDVTEDDEEAWNRTDNAYNWNPGDTPGTFTPQKSGYYVVELTLTDGYLADTEKVAYEVLDIRQPADITPERIDWLQNNIASVVLFAISAALAVAIVVLFVVKPAEKNVEEVDLEKLKGKRKNDKK